MDRELDVVVYGATGYTGELLAQVLAKRGMPAIGLGGRSAEKLAARRAALAAKWPIAASWPLLVADAGDAAALEAMCARTRVVASTVGPYERYGLPLVGAALAQGTHYADLTGEVPFMRASIDRHHDAAVARGVRLVHACGYDSIPSDLGTWVLQQEARRRSGQPLPQVVHGAGEARGGVSGGTVHSGLDLVARAARDRDYRRLVTDPYGLDPRGGHRGPDGRDPTRLAWDEALGSWVAPFFMAPVNTRVVRRTNALLDYPYGRGFRYREVSSTGRGAGGLARAAAFTGAYLGFGAMAAVPATASLLQRVLPAPGEGPSEQTRAEGYFVSRFAGLTDDGQVALRGRFSARFDPGYGGTAIMLAESALLLAQGSEGPGGVLTPASAFGDALAERLRAAGFTVEAG